MHKKKLFGILALLLVCIVVMVSASFAWLTLSTAPEVSGINTYVGANGNLEIALLDSKTFMDPSLITTSVGDSSEVKEITESNKTWGNVVDLSHTSYGLSKISLYPSRLNVTQTAQLPVVSNNNMLVIPRFDVDGRRLEMVSNTLTASLGENDKFIYNIDSQSFGVRGIGSPKDSRMTSQQAALTGAKTLVSSYTLSAQSASESAWNANGDKFLKIYIDHYIDGKDLYSGADLAVVRDTANRMQSAIGYIDAALRQGAVAMAASEIADENTFNVLRKQIENTSVQLSAVLQSASDIAANNFGEWVTTTEEQAIVLQRIVGECDKYASTGCNWEQMYAIVSDLLNSQDTYLNNIRLNQINSQTKLNVLNSVVISKNSGVFAVVAEYCGNYTADFNYAKDVGIEVKTVSNSEKPHLVRLREEIENKKPSAENNQITGAELEEMYGYAVDLAFRCSTNATLQLQTSPENRVNGQTQNPISMGGGSYMQFTAEQLDVDRAVRTMDAIRVGFLDNRNQLLALGKLNISNFEADQNEVKAPLYLYDYSLSPDGSISMGERLKDKNGITLLSGGMAKVITVVVWIDGDHIDNGLAASSSMKKMKGSLNLQFSTDVKLESANIPLG